MNKDSNIYWSRCWPVASISIPASEEARIGEILNNIPVDCSSIIDLGCGDGRIINRLSSKYGRVCGLDCSKEGLRHVSCDKVLGILESLPLADNSFDLVICCEVLEHLPFEVYPKALKEIERVAGKYILITVPNGEDLKRSQVSCPHCGCVFHVNRHVRSFNPGNLNHLFAEFKPQTVRPCVFTKQYPRFVLEAARFLHLLGTSFPEIALCPQCGYHLENIQLSERPKNNRSYVPTAIIRRLADIIPKKYKGGWLLALYKRV